MKITKYLFPIKSTIFTITMAGLLLGIRLALGFFSVNLGPVTLSLSWTSLFIAGFILGPIIGYAFGWISDSFGFLIHPGSAGYMWEYSIQEGLIVLIGALFGILYRLLKNNKSKWAFFIVFEVILTAAIGFGVFMLSKYFDFTHVVSSASSNWIDSKWIKITALVLILLTYIVTNIVVVILINKKQDANLVMIVTLTVLVTWVLFAWIMGPWVNVRWYQKIYNHMPSSYATYGYKVYSLASILKSLFMIPIETLLVYGVWKAFIVWSRRSEMIRK